MLGNLKFEESKRVGHFGEGENISALHCRASGKHHRPDITWTYYKNVTRQQMKRGVIGRTRMKKHRKDEVPESIDVKDAYA